MVITPGKDDGQTHWHFRYEGEHRLTDFFSERRDHNKPCKKVNLHYNAQVCRISKTSKQLGLILFIVLRLSCPGKCNACEDIAHHSHK